MNIILVLFVFIMPAVIMFLERRIAPIKKIGAITICYALGFCLAVLDLPYDKALCETLASAAVAIAIPAILFGTDLLAIRGVGKKMLLSFGLMAGIVMVVSAAAACIGTAAGTESPAALSGMATGLYIGGTPNMFAIGKALLPGDPTLINSVYIADSIVGGIYFLLIISVIKKIYARVLGGRRAAHDGSSAVESHAAPEDGQSNLPVRKRILPMLLLVVLAAACFGVGLLIEYLVNGNLEGSLLIMLTVSVLGIALSFIKPIRALEKRNEKLGQYLVLVFSLSLGMSLDIHRLASVMLTCLVYFGGIQLASALIHFIVCRILKIDGGTALVTSVAAIYGPPFVVTAANAYGDDSLIAPGVICGVLGLIAGNLLGIGWGWLLALVL